MESNGGVASFFLLNETCSHLALVHNIRLESKPPGWGLPGGRINGHLDEENGSSYFAHFKKAAFRELLEETGLAEDNVLNLEFFHIFTATARILSSVSQLEAPHATIPVVVFAGIALKDIVKTTAVPKETDGCDWFLFNPDDPTAHLPSGTYRSHAQRIQEFVEALKKDYAWYHIQYIRAQQEEKM